MTRSRVVGIVGSAWAALMGALPHVLHHVGPLAGAAFVAGTTGTIVFGLLAFAFTIPMLVRIRRHRGSWRLPLALLATFIAVWAASTWLVGPWVQDQLADEPPVAERESGDTPDPDDHDAHHPDE